MRLAAWEARLSAYIARCRTLPHAYGTHDCLLHCAATVEAVTGRDHGAEHRGKYDARTFRRYLARLGFDSAEAMIDSLLEQKPTAFAHRGDIILASDGIPAVCMGAFALSVGPQGLVKVPRADWVKAWRVG